jgi:hypothetical protein
MRILDGMEKEGNWDIIGKKLIVVFEINEIWRCTRSSMAAKDMV